METATYLDLSIYLLFGLIWIGIVAFLRLKKRKIAAYLFLFTVFYIYMYKVLDYTLFQFQSLLLLRLFVPGLILQGQAHDHAVNLVPLVTLSPDDLKTSLL